MRKALLHVVAVLFVVGCGSETKPVITMDAVDCTNPPVGGRWGGGA